MKKIIASKLYDTETAYFIGSWDNRYNRSDFQWCEENLYQTKSGKYFLHGEGGAMSKYREECGNRNWCGGSDLIVLSKAEAITWAEEHLTADEFIAEFKTVEEA